jgi:hypothetical protein
MEKLARFLRAVQERRVALSPPRGRPAPPTVQHSEASNPPRASPYTTGLAGSAETCQSALPSVGQAEAPRVWRTCCCCAERIIAPCTKVPFTCSGRRTGPCPSSGRMGCGWILHPLHPTGAYPTRRRSAPQRLGCARLASRLDRARARLSATANGWMPCGRSTCSGYRGVTSTARRFRVERRAGHDLSRVSDRFTPQRRPEVAHVVGSPNSARLESLSPGAASVVLHWATTRE